MRSRTALLTVSVTLAAMIGATAPVKAQSFGRALERLGRSALAQARPKRTVPSDSPSTPTSAASFSKAPDPAPAGVTPWPINAGLVERAHKLRFAPEVEAQKKRFLDASGFACSTCEASLDFDSWRRAFRPLRDTDSAWSEILASWTVGRELPWRGTAHDGVIRVVSEVPVGGIRCRQLHHSISTRGRSPVVHERPGLICFDRKGDYGGTPVWHEVF